jgi:hypothetical protein
MSLTNWTLWGDSAGFVIDYSDYIEGNGSGKYYITTGNGGGIVRNDFSCSNVCIVCWNKMKCDFALGGGVFKSKLKHVSYGELPYLQYQTGHYFNTSWEKFRGWFWYDSDSDVRLGRLEKWDGSNWIQQGSDVYFGTGEPVSDAIQFNGDATGTAYGGMRYIYWDGIKVYDVVF